MYYTNSDDADTKPHIMRGQQPTKGFGITGMVKGSIDDEATEALEAKRIRM